MITNEQAEAIQTLADIADDVIAREEIPDEDVPRVREAIRLAAAVVASTRDAAKAAVDDTLPAGMTAYQVDQVLTAQNIPVYLRPMGSSGGADWFGVEVTLPDGAYILITPDGGPWASNDEVAERLLALRYAPGPDLDDEGDREWVGLAGINGSDADEFDATERALVDQVRALMSLEIEWPGRVDL